MKVLYVCRSNIGRSQIAEAYHNHFGGEADSAGTRLRYLEGTILDTSELGAGKIILTMKEEGIEINEKRLKYLDQKMVEEYEKIIVMAEPETWPQYLRACNKIEYWDINDPKRASFRKIRRIRDKIKGKVRELLSQNA